MPERVVVPRMVGADHPFHGCPETYSAFDPCKLFDTTLIP